MGMDQQGAAALKQGLNLTRDFMGLVNNGSDTGSDGSDLAEAQARLTEQDAMGEAHDRRRQAKEAAADYRDTAEHRRAADHASWGASGLAMSGSKQIINQSQRLKDGQAEDDILFRGDQDAQSTLNQARNRANLTRIGNGSSANRSTLSLGSKLYKYGG